MDHGNNDNRRQRYGQIAAYGTLTGYGLVRNKMIKSVMQGAKMPALSRFGLPAMIMMGSLWAAKQATGGSKAIRDEVSERHKY